MEKNLLSLKYINNISIIRKNRILPLSVLMTLDNHHVPLVPSIVKLKNHASHSDKKKVSINTIKSPYFNTTCAPRTSK